MYVSANLAYLGTYFLWSSNFAMTISACCAALGSACLCELLCRRGPAAAEDVPQPVRCVCAAAWAWVLACS